MKFKNVKLARLVETLQSLFLERSYRYHRKMEKSLLTSFMNCTTCVDNIIMCDLLWDFFFSNMEHRVTFFRSLQIAHHACTHTQAKNMFTEYIIIKKLGEAVCILAQAVSVLCCFPTSLPVIRCFLCVGNLLKYAFPLPNKHDCSAFDFCLLLLRLKTGST